MIQDGAVSWLLYDSTIVTFMVIIAIIVAVYKMKISRLNKMCDCLEEANDSLKKCVEDAGRVICKQDNAIRQMTNLDSKENCHDVPHVIEAIYDQEKRDSMVNQNGWNLYLVKRSDGAPSIGMLDLHSALVVSDSSEKVIEILKDDVSFVDDGWWDVVPVYLNDSSAGIIMST